MDNMVTIELGIYPRDNPTEMFRRFKVKGLRETDFKTRIPELRASLIKTVYDVFNDCLVEGTNG